MPKLLPLRKECGRRLTISLSVGGSLCVIQLVEMRKPYPVKGNDEMNVAWTDAETFFFFLALHTSRIFSDWKLKKKKQLPEEILRTTLSSSSEEEEEMEWPTPVQILGEAVYVVLHTYALRKSKNPLITSTYKSRLGSLAFVRQLV